MCLQKLFRLESLFVIVAINKFSFFATPPKKIKHLWYHKKYLLNVTPPKKIAFTEVQIVLPCFHFIDISSQGFFVARPLNSSL